MWVKKAAGLFLGGVGILFLVINSILLARGALRWGLELWEQISYAAVAATVPWVIAAMPLIVAMSWRPGKRFSAPSILTFLGLGIWLAFVAYNLTGAASSIALVRDDVVSTRKHHAGSLQADEAMRERLTREANEIPRHRPAGTVASLLAAKKAQREWDWSEKCKEAKNTRERRFCGEVAALEGELAAAKRAVELNDQIAALNTRVYSAGPAAVTVDPEARLISNLTGWNERWVSENLPLKTPILLELGSMTLIYFAAVLLGFTHTTQATAALSSAPTQQRAAAASPGPLRPAEPRQSILPSPPPIASLTRQRELAEWFFKECSRPAASGSLPEGQWYEHYRSICKESADQPLSLERFRKFAGDFVRVEEIDGQWFYLGALPYVPKRVA